jgi:hypothetical protein
LDTDNTRSVRNPAAANCAITTCGCGSRTGFRRRAGSRAT